MIKSVTVINHLGEELKMELQHPETSGFYIRSIEGLGPVQANINVIDNAILDGASFNSARVSYRNIVLNLGFMFTNTIEEVRHKSYKYFPPKRNVTLLIETDTRVCETYGYVEYNNPDIFSSNEVAQVSIICPDPRLYDVNNNTIELAGVTPAFSFPFSNESIDEKQIVFGEVASEAIPIINYVGDIETGIRIRIHVIGDASDIVIYNVITGEYMFIDTTRLKNMLGTNFELVEGDDIIISTARGSKSVTLLRNGETINIINCLDRYSDWFQLAHGSNEFTYEAKVGFEKLQFIFEYQTAYIGV